MPSKSSFFLLILQGTYATHISSLVVVLAGGLIGLAWSCICVAFIALNNKNNGGIEAVGSRVLAAVFVAIAALSSGYVRSSSPRLGTAAR